jgi:hypothetical protein
MSIVSKHFPEVLDAQRESACTCEPDGHGAADFCPACRAEYDAWREQIGAGLPLPGEEYEPCGQQFQDGPLPPDTPF